MGLGWASSRSRAGRVGKPGGTHPARRWPPAMNPASRLRMTHWVFGSTPAMSGAAALRPACTRPVMRMLPPVPTNIQVRITEYAKMLTTSGQSRSPWFIWPGRNRPTWMSVHGTATTRAARSGDMTVMSRGIAKARQATSSANAGSNTTRKTITIAGKTLSNRPADGAPSPIAMATVARAQASGRARTRYQRRSAGRKVSERRSRPRAP